MDLIFTADLHGNREQYTKIFEYAQKNQIKTIILGGDLTPKDSQHRNPESQKLFLQTFLLPKIQTFHGKVLLILGNDDFRSNLSFLEQNQDTYGYHLLYTPFEYEGFYFVGYSYVPYTPFMWKDWERRDLKTDTLKELRSDVRKEGFLDFNKPCHIVTDFSKNAIETDLEKLTTNVLSQKLILITHTPPADTALDLTKDKSGKLRHVGSYGVKKIIEEKQPLLTLHGHIHDSVKNSGVYCETLGQTLSCAVGNDHLVDNPFILEISLSPILKIKRKELK